MHFGLTDAAGRAPSRSWARWRPSRAILDAVDIGRCARADSDTALVIPAYLDTSYPFTDPDDRTLPRAQCCARPTSPPGWPTCRSALTRESDGIGGDARLYLVPSVKQLLTPTCHQLERLAADGAVVYVSYSPGDNGWHRGPWYARLNAMFGVGISSRTAWPTRSRTTR